MPAITAEEKRWRAEGDAHTLAEAKAIEKDPARKQAAITAAKKMAKEQVERAQAMQRVANQKVSGGPRVSNNGSSQKINMRNTPPPRR